MRSRPLAPFEESPEQAADRPTGTNSILAIVAALGMLALGLVMRNNTLNATVTFNDEINGISGQLPANWLLDTTSDDYVFRAENLDGLPFKTVIQVSIQPIGPDANPNNVVDALNLIGPARLDGYRVLSTEQTTLGEDDATQISYEYIEAEANPFLESISIVVQGIDLVVTRGNQAIVFTYRDSAATFEDNRFYFENFLATVEY